MNSPMTIMNGGRLSGQLLIPSSKSLMHRHIICAAAAGGGSIICTKPCDDALCTLDSLSAVGFGYSFTESGVSIFPAEKKNNIAIAESGSTLRFMLPVICALSDKPVTITLGHRLSQRPIYPLISALNAKGADISLSGEIMTVKGKIAPGSYAIDRSTSSQFVSGLLLALPMLGIDSEIIPTGGSVSEGYIDMTLGTLEEYGIEIQYDGRRYYIRGGQRFIPHGAVCEGDCSTAAFFAAAAAISGSSVTLKGLNAFSKQGDRAVFDILRGMGAEIKYTENGTEVIGHTLHGAEIYCENIPDLVPVLALVCSLSEGISTLYGVERLKYKESDRITSTLELIRSLGGNISYEDGGFYIRGVSRLAGGGISAHGDHRIAMTAAVSALACTSPVTIDDAGCVSKSCPDFFGMFNSMRAK